MSLVSGRNLQQQVKKCINPNPTSPNAVLRSLRGLACVCCCCNTVTPASLADRVPFRAVAGYSTAFVDPYAALRSKGPMPTDPEGSTYPLNSPSYPLPRSFPFVQTTYARLSLAFDWLRASAVKKQMQEQQLRARQMVLQQQASSAVAAASKTQREVRKPLTRLPVWFAFKGRPSCAGDRRVGLPCARRCFCSCHSPCRCSWPLRTHSRPVCDPSSRTLLSAEPAWGCLLIRTERNPHDPNGAHD